MKLAFYSKLAFKLSLSFIIITSIVFLISNSIQLTLAQKELKKQGAQQIQTQRDLYKHDIKTFEKNLIQQFPPLLNMLAEFSKAPLLARISATDHSNFDSVNAIQNCFQYNKQKNAIKQCIDIVVFRFITNKAIAEINQSFIKTTVDFLLQNEDLAGIYIEDWDAELYIGLRKGGKESKNLQPWNELSQLSNLPHLKKEILDEEGEYLGKIVFAYSLKRIEKLKLDAEKQLDKSTAIIEENIRKHNQNTIIGNLLTGIIFFLILIAALYFFTIRLIIRPVYDLRDSANKIAEGDLSTRTSITSRDEIGFLADSLNNMAQNLQNTMTSRDELALEVTQRKKAEEEKEKIIRDLEKAMKDIQTLKGIVPICSYCKQIRDDEGYWNNLEKYISEHTEAEFSHGICETCARKHFPEFME